MADTRTAGDTGQVAYDHTAIQVREDRLALTRDLYSSFGWLTEPGSQAERSSGTSRRVILRLRRDRRVGDREVVRRLEQEAESALRSIDRIERRRRLMPALSGWLVGVLGAAFLAGSVFSLLADLVMLSVVLGVIGIGLWSMAYPAYRGLRSRRPSLVRDELDRQYDFVHDAAARARHLLRE